MLCLRFAVTHQHDFLKYPDQSSTPKGLRDESARAVTGRRRPHSGVGEDFLTRRPSFFFYKKDCNSETKSRKSFRRLEMNCLSEGYKNFWAKNRDFGPNKWRRTSQ